MGVRYVVDENGKRVGVLLDIEEYERMVEELEEMEDVRAAEEVRAAIERGEEDLLPFDEAVKEIEEERKRLKGEGLVRSSHPEENP